MCDLLRAWWWRCFSPGITSASLSWAVRTESCIFGQTKNKFRTHPFPPGERCSPCAAPLYAERETYRANCTFHLVVLCKLNMVSPLVAYSLRIKHSTQKGGKSPKPVFKPLHECFIINQFFLVGWKSFVRKFSGDLLNVTDTEEALVFRSSLPLLHSPTSLCLFI